MANLPLLELFTRLREAGFPLGIDDYQAALAALQAGFGIGDRAALARLCRTLWVKSEAERRQFDYYFDRTIVPEPQSSPSSPSSAPAVTFIPVAEPSPSDETPIELFDLRQILTTMGIYALSAGVVTLPYVFYALIGRANHLPVFTSQPVEEAIYGQPYQYNIKAEDIDPGDRLVIEAWIEIEGQQRQITERGIGIGKPRQKTLDYSDWLRFEDRGNGTATLFGIVEHPENKARLGSGIDGDSRYPIELRVKDPQGGLDRQTFYIRETDEPSRGRPFPILVLLLIYAAFPAVLYFIYRRSQTATAQSPAESPSPADPAAAPEKTVTSARLTETTDETRVPSPAPPLAPNLLVLSRRSFRQTSEYFPLTRRQMKQSWRFLRRLVRSGLPTELDVEATLNQISRQGIVLEPVLVPRRVNQSRLLLLIDQDGSMVPFHAFAERLADTAVRGGRLGETHVCYFHNCPMEYVYRDRYCHQAEPIDAVLDAVQSAYTGVLVFSDAGAARGTFNPERLDCTAAFLTALKQRIRHISWLNPVPSDRWSGTTASQIARFVPMFEFNRRGLHRAISVLRGRLR